MTTTRTPSRPQIAVAMLKNIGARLSVEERPPYEIDQHDSAVDLDEPTGEIVARDLLDKKPVKGTK